MWTRAYGFSIMRMRYPPDSSCFNSRICSSERKAGLPTIDAATNGPMGTIRSGTLERSNVDITEELVMLIAAQRNFQANAKAIEGASTLTQTVINMRT